MVLTSDKLADSTCSFQSALHSIEDHRKDVNKEAEEGMNNSVDSIEGALESGEYDLKDRGDEIL